MQQTFLNPFPKNIIHAAEMIHVGNFGKSVGLKGAMRVSLFTDFPEILQKDICLYIAYNENLDLLQHIFDTTAINQNTTFSKEKTLYIPLHIANFNPTNNTIRFQEIQKREEAQTLCRTPFYSTIEETRTLCALDENEFFYFDIIGMRVIENGAEIGVVQDILELANTHYLVLDAHFLIPYIDRYVLATDSRKREIMTKDARYLRMR